MAARAALANRRYRVNMAIAFYFLSYRANQKARIMAKIGVAVLAHGPGLFMRNDAL